MDDEHSPHQEEVNTAVSPPQGDKDAVLEEIPSTSTKHQVRSSQKFLIII